MSLTVTRCMQAAPQPSIGPPRHQLVGQERKPLARPALVEAGDLVVATTRTQRNPEWERVEALADHHLHGALQRDLGGDVLELPAGVAPQARGLREVEVEVNLV